MAQSGDDVTGRTLEWRYDGNNKVWAYAYCEAGATALTPGMVQFYEGGYRYVAMADNTHTYLVGVPDGTIASGDFAWIQIGGPADDVITASLSVSVGHALKIYDGAVADAGADFSGEAGEFAVNRTATTTATAHDVILVPKYVLGTT